LANDLSKLEKQFSNLERLLEKTDEQLGEFLAGAFLPPTKNALARLGQRATRRRWAVLQAIQDPSSALEWMAIFLAIDGEFVLAGKTLRAVLLPQARAFSHRQIAELSREIARCRIREKQLDEKIRRQLTVLEVGRDIRKREKGWPMNNSDLADEIAKRTGFSANTIRTKDIHDLELDAERWRGRVRAQNPVKPSSKKKPRKKSNKAARLRGV
jgi:hypothetical protein